MKIQSVKTALMTLSVFCGWSVTSLASQEEPYVSMEDWSKQGRPANFYKIGANKNRRVCSLMLDALNEPAIVQKEFGAFHDRTEPKRPGRSTWFRALHSRYSIEWQPLKHWNSNRSVERAIIDLNNDGTDEAVYREVWRGVKSQFLYHTIEVTETYDIDEISFTRSRRDQIQKERFGKRLFRLHPILPKNAISTLYINVDGFIDGVPWPRFFVNGRHEGFKEVVEVEGKHYLLLAQYDYYKHSPYYVYLLSVEDTTHQKLMCRFDSALSIRRK